MRLAPSSDALPRTGTDSASDDAAPSPVVAILAGRETVVALGARLLDVCDRFPELPFVFGCREGGCGTCVIRVVAGAEHLSSRTEAESILLEAFADGHPAARLGCRVRLHGPATLEPWGGARGPSGA